jgi:hypothetical protein
MQFAKDSFSMALRVRLAALNPGRTVTVSGAQRPAVVVLENEMPTPADLLTECFYLEWGGLKAAEAGSGPRVVCSVDCTITYSTRGSVESGVDRGRVLGELDRELFMICQPAYTVKQDFSQAPVADLGTGVFWTMPSVAEGKTSFVRADYDPALAEHKAQVTVYFFPEVESL